MGIYIKVFLTCIFTNNWILFQKVCLKLSIKKRTSQILTGPNKFVILGDQT